MSPMVRARTGVGPVEVVVAVVVEAVEEKEKEADQSLK